MVTFKQVYYLYKKPTRYEKPLGLKEILSIIGNDPRGITYLPLLFIFNISQSFRKQSFSQNE